MLSLCLGSLRVSVYQVHVKYLKTKQRTMVYCAVTGCTNNNNKKTKNNSTSYRYFTFPTAKEVCNLWVQKCYQKHNFKIKNARICSDHFTDDDFCEKEKLLQLPRNKWKLGKNAVPSLNLAKSLKAKTTKQIDREERTKKRDIIKNIHNLQKKHDLTLTNIGEGSGEVLGELGEALLISSTGLGELETETTSRDISTQTMSSMDLKPLEQTKSIQDVEGGQKKFVKLTEELNQNLSSTNPRLIHVPPTQIPQNMKLLDESSGALVSSQGAHQTFVTPSTADNPVTTPIIIIPQVSGAIPNNTLVLPKNFGKKNLILTPLSSVGAYQQENVQQFGIGTTSQLIELTSTTAPVQYVDSSVLENSYADGVSNNISEKTKKGMEMRCRTCLDPVPNHLEQASMSVTCFEGKSVKESLEQLIPKMISSLADDHFICANCFVSLKNALGFVKKCLEAESVIAGDLKIDSRNAFLEKHAKQQFTNTELPLSDTIINERNEYPDNEYEIDEDINFDKDISFDEEDDDDDDEDDDVHDDHGDNDSLFECDIDVEEHDYVLNGITNLIKANEGKKNQKFDRKQSDLCNNVIKYLKFLPLEYAKVGDHDRIVSIPNLDPDFVYTLQKNKIKFLQNCAKFDENVFKNKRVLLIGSHTKIKCLLCEEHFNTEEEMRVHISDIHGFTRAFMLDTYYYQYLPGSSIYCEACGKNCRTIASKNVHLKNCFVFPCPYCDKLFAPFELPKHTSEQHNDPKPFKCFYCKQEKNSFVRFKSHLCEILNCEKCGKDFENKNSLRIHKNKCYPEDVTTKRCSECKLRFSLSSFQSHAKTHELPCSVCGKLMPNRRVLYKHEYNHGVKKGSLCPFCGKLVSYLPKHIKMHKDDQLQAYTCSLCSKTFINKSNLNRHVKLYHMTTRIVCEKCGKIFSEYYIENHYKSEHPNEKVFKCAKCESSFTMIAFLKQHAKSHANEVKEEHDRNKISKKPKQRREYRSRERRVYRHTDLFKKVKSKIKGIDAPITCKHCLKTLKDLYQYRSHLETHVALYRFKCKFCDMTYSSARNKDRHEKLHEDPNYKFRCGECWKVMKSQEELDDHMEHHASKPKRYQCGECFELFGREYQLRSHVVNKHTLEGEIEEAKEDVIIDALMDFTM